MSLDFERDLRDAMAARTSGAVAAPDLAATVRARFRRRRRNRRIAAAAALAVAIAVPGGARLLARPDTGSAAQQITAARPPSGIAGRGLPAPAPTPSPASSLGPGRTVGGVDITWLPAGLTLERSSVMASQTVTGALTYRSEFDDQRAFLDVDVQWGTAPSLDAVQATMGADQPYRTFSRTTVRGHPALFTQVTGKDEAALIWAEQPGLLLSVGWGDPTSEADARRVADGLTVRGPPASASAAAASTVSPAAAEEAIRTAFLAVFTGNVSPSRALAAIENGSSVAAARAALLASHPALSRTLRVTVNTVILEDATHATVTFTLTYTDPTMIESSMTQPTANGGRRFDTSGNAVRTAGGWQVARSTYCTIVGLAGTNC